MLRNASRSFFGFFFVFALITAPMAFATELNSSDEAAMSAHESENGEDAAIGGYYNLPWTCVAQSYASGLWYYWRAYNAYHARNMALNACVSQNGYTCNVNCRYGY